MFLSYDENTFKNNYKIFKPFIPFARDSEGGITSFFKLASNKGEGDLIFDGGFTKIL